MRPPLIDGVRTYPDGREVCDCQTAAGDREYKRRTAEMATRQFNICAGCRDHMMRPTFDHEAGRGLGGSRTDDRIVVNGKWHNAALCGDCNQRKGSKRYTWAYTSIGSPKYVPVEMAKVS